MNRLQAAKEIVYDCETSGLMWNKMHVVGHVLTFGPNPGESFYLPVRHAGGGNIGGVEGPSTPFNWDGKPHKIERDLIKLLDRQDLNITGHGIGFDLKFLFRLGLKFSAHFFDSIINEPLLNEYAGKFSLEACSIRHKVQVKKLAQIIEYLCSKFPEAAKDPKRAMGHYWRLAGDDPIGVEYAEGDGTSTWQLRDKQMIEIRKADRYQGHDIPSLEKVWDIESRLIPILARMSCRGIKIDLEELDRLGTFIKSQIGDNSINYPGELVKDFPDDFNFRSPSDVKYWMTERGHTDWPMTPPSKRFPKTAENPTGGQPSMAKGWLENSDDGRRIVKVRKLETLRDTFVNPLRSTHVNHGRVHTNYNQLRQDEFGTVSGRLSCQDPNLQAVPKHDEDIGSIYRKVFIPDQGMIWASPDYNQCEPRLLAYYSRCKVLMQGYLADPPLDAHTAVAIACNKNWPNMTDKERKYYRNEFAKRINQTIITGGGQKVLVDKYKVDPLEVDRVWKDYFKAMPEVKTIQKQMTRRLEQRGYILTLLNRRCHTPPDGRTYVGLNKALQGGNADILKLKMVEVDDYLKSEGYPIDMLNNCHDAVDFQFAEEHRKHYDRCIEIMQDFTSADAVIKLDIPIPVDGGEGKNWAEASYPHLKGKI